MAETLIYISTWRIKEGRLEDFKRFTRELVDIFEAREPQLIAFNVFLNEDETEMTSIQVHPNADSMDLHLQEVSFRAHLALGCSGYSRVDLRLADDGTPYVLEVNTLPGMTPISDLPRAAAVAGIPYPDLVARMLATADSKEV